MSSLQVKFPPGMRLNEKSAFIYSIIYLYTFKLSHLCVAVSSGKSFFLSLFFPRGFVEVKFVHLWVELFPFSLQLPFTV